MFSMTELKPRTKCKPLLVVARYDDDLCMLREDASGFESDSIDGRASDQDYLKSVRAYGKDTKHTIFALNFVRKGGGDLVGSRCGCKGRSSGHLLWM
jgi:hypothetical protein